MSVSVFLKNVAHTTGEGPVWDQKRQCFTHVDIVSGEVSRYNVITGERTGYHCVQPEYDMLGFCVPTEKGDYIIGPDQTIMRLNFDTNPVETTKLKDVDTDVLVRFNDGKCDAAGRLWAGTMGRQDFPKKPMPDPGLGGLFSLSPDGKVQKHDLDKYTLSNGMAWTGDNRTMFFIDTVPKKIYAFNFDVDHGTIDNQREALDFTNVGNPDGMCIDAKDHLWVAVFGSGKVVQFDPETRTQLSTIEFPHSKQVTSCCWGGPNCDDLYVTTCRTGLSDTVIKNEQPLAGSIYKVTGLGVKGMPATYFAG